MFAPVLRRVAGAVLRRPSARLVLVIIVAVAFCIRFVGTGYGLPAEFRPDEIYVVNRSLGILAGQYDASFFFWPSLYFWLVAPVYLVVIGIGGVVGLGTWGPQHAVQQAVNDPSAYVLTVRLISVACGALLPVPVYLLGSRVGGRIVGLLAAAVAAIAFLSVRESHFGLQDSPAALAVAFALFAAVRTYTTTPHTSWLAEGAGMRWWIASGALAGATFALKYHPVLVIAPIMLLALRRGWRPALVTGVAALLAGTLLQPELFIKPGDVISGLAPRVLPTWYVLSYYVEHLLPAAVGLPIMALVVVGSIRAAAQRALVPLALVLHVVVIVVVLGHGAGGYERYLLPLLPSASVLAAYGAEWVRAPFRSARAHGFATATAVLVLCVALVPMFITDASFDRLATGRDTRTTTYEWALAHIPAGSLVATTYFGGIFHSVAWAARFNPTSYYGTAREIVDNQVGPWRERLMDDNDQVPIAESLRPTDVDYIVVSSSYPYQRFAVPVPTPKGFQLVYHIQPLDSTARPHYDRFDGFYIPIGDFSGVRSPGPEIYVFKSRSCASKA